MVKAKISFSQFNITSHILYLTILIILYVICFSVEERKSLLKSNSPKISTVISSYFKPSADSTFSIFEKTAINPSFELSIEIPKNSISFVTKDFLHMVKSL